MWAGFYFFKLGNSIQVFTLLFFIPFNYDGSAVQEGRESLKAAQVSGMLLK